MSAAADSTTMIGLLAFQGYVLFKFWDFHRNERDLWKQVARLQSLGRRRNALLIEELKARTEANDRSITLLQQARLEFEAAAARAREVKP